MAEKLTISQLNKLGERLRKAEASDNDLRALDTFRLSFTSAYDRVFHELSKLRLNPGGRPAKSTSSIIAKLNRERGRLSKMQDIAGCRIEVENLVEQDRVVAELVAKFPNAVVHDRRIKPSHGYRAVHLVVDSGGFLVEIQIRTPLQHGWASAIEKLADTIDPDIKYGGGPEEIRKTFSLMSQNVGLIEALEIVLPRIRGSRRSSIPDEEVRKTEQTMLEARAHLHELFESFTMIADKEV